MLCVIDIDECSSHPCQKGGTCTDRANAFACKCPVGYSGANCETSMADTNIGDENNCSTIINIYVYIYIYIYICIYIYMYIYINIYIYICVCVCVCMCVCACVCLNCLRPYCRRSNHINI